MIRGLGHGCRAPEEEEQLGRAQRRNAVRAVAAERERIGRDLHDILGHSLTSLTISAQLAQRLIEADPAAARAQLAHIEQTSRQALADVRATSSGMRTVRIPAEVARRSASAWRLVGPMWAGCARAAAGAARGGRRAGGGVLGGDVWGGARMAGRSRPRPARA